MVRGGLFTPLCEPWLLLIHLCGSLDGSGQPFLSISGSLGLIFIHFGPHFEYFCMCKKAKIITSTQQPDATQPNKIKGTYDQFLSKKRELNRQHLLRRPSKPKKNWTSPGKLNSIHPSLHPSSHPSCHPSVKRVHSSIHPYIH